MTALHCRYRLKHRCTKCNRNKSIYSYVLLENEVFVVIRVISVVICFKLYRNVICDLVSNIEKVFQTSSCFLYITAVEFTLIASSILRSALV